MTDNEIFEEKFEDLEMTCILTFAKCMEKEWPKKISQEIRVRRTVDEGTVLLGSGPLHTVFLEKHDVASG